MKRVVLEFRLSARVEETDDAGHVVHVRPVPNWWQMDDAIGTRLLDQAFSARDMVRVDVLQMVQQAQLEFGNAAEGAEVFLGAVVEAAK